MRSLTFAIIRNSFISESIYRFNFILSIISRLVFIITGYFLWNSLLNNSIQNQYNNDVTSEKMITYIIISAFISMILQNRVIYNMDEKIRSGQLAVDLTKPVSIPVLVFTETVGKNILKITFEFIPVAFIGFMILGAELPDLNSLMQFIPALFFSMILYFAITFSIGILGFWYKTIWHLDRFLQDCIRILSGALIPIWFFPGILRNVTEYLPFKYLYFVPISIYLGDYSINEVLRLFAVQILWVVVFIAIAGFLWNKGIHKLEIQGG